MMLRDQFQTIPLLLCLLSIATIKTEKSPLCIDLDVDCPEYELTATHEIDGVKFEIRDYPPMRLLYTRLEYLSMNFTFNEGSEKLDEYTAQLKDDNGTQLKAVGPKMLFYMLPDFSAIVVAQYAPDYLQDPAIEAPEFENSDVRAMLAPPGTKFTKTLNAEEIGYGMHVKAEIAEFVQVLKKEGYEKFMEQKVVVYSEEPLRAEIWIVRGDQEPKDKEEKEFMGIDKEDESGSDTVMGKIIDKEEIII